MLQHLMPYKEPFTAFINTNYGKTLLTTKHWKVAAKMLEFLEIFFMMQLFLCLVFITQEGPAKEESELTAREREVLQLVAEGATNREIAAALFLSGHTINFHMRNILQKLHLRNRAQAVAYAIRTGLVTPREAP
jgi:DNA-binding CsgD family transcriptional regulator